MKKVNANKAMKSAYLRYKYSIAFTLGDVYNQCSDEKYAAYSYCRRLYYSLGGINFRIIGANCMTFSVGFEFADENTGELCFAYITKSYDRFCTVPTEWIE